MSATGARAAMAAKNTLVLLTFLSTICMAMTRDVGDATTNFASHDPIQRKFLEKKLQLEEVSQKILWLSYEDAYTATSGVDSYLRNEAGYMMTTGVDLYLAFYGNWSATRLNSIITFFSSLGSNSDAKSYPSLGDWWNVLSTYKNSSGKPISSEITVKGTLLYGGYEFGTLVSYANTTEFAVHAAVFADWNITSKSVFMIFVGDDVQMVEGCNTCYGFGSLSIMVRSLPTTCNSTCHYSYTNAQDPTADPYVGQALHSMAVGLVSHVTNPAHDDVGNYSNVGGSGVGSACESNASFVQVNSTSVSFSVYGNDGKKYIVPPIYNYDTKQCDIGLALPKKSGRKIGLIVGVVVAVAVVLVLLGIVTFIFYKRRAGMSDSLAPSHETQNDGVLSRPPKSAT